MDALFDLIMTYGVWIYALLFVYCAAKSGALPLFAGFAAQQGALDPFVASLCSFGGGYLGDELRFWWARRYGLSFLARWPKLAALSDKASDLLDRRGAWYIFLYRYPKGLRTIGALPVGLGSMSWARFTVFNAASTFVWVALLVGGGYLLGETIANALIINWGSVSVALLAALILLASLVYWRIQRAVRDQDFLLASTSVSASVPDNASASASRPASAFSAAQAPAASTATGDAVGRTLK